MIQSQTFANPDVLEFYKILPFNYTESVQSSVQAIQERDPIATYPVLKPLLAPGVTVLDVGCGAGWFANAMEYRHGCVVTGIDFNPVAVARAQQVAESMNLRTRFQVADLFTYEPEQPFDLAVSIGVLHHTNDCHAAIRRVERCVKPGGYAFIGLYHAHGRKPLLKHFEEMKRRGASEDEMLERYRQLHSQLKDDVHLRSWFRDQVLHPHETQHTLEEVNPILHDCGLTLLSTSINKFQPFDEVGELFRIEKTYQDLADQRLRQNRYFTGFFVFLARKSEAGAC